MLSFDKDRRGYDRSVETLLPEDVFAEISDPKRDEESTSTQPSVLA